MKAHAKVHRPVAVKRDRAAATFQFDHGITGYFWVAKITGHSVA